MRLLRLISVFLCVAIAASALGGAVGGLIAFALPATAQIVLDVELGPGRPAAPSPDASSSDPASNAATPAAPDAAPVRPHASFSIKPEPILGIPSTPITRGAALGAAAGLVLGMLLGLVVALIDQVMVFSRAAMSALTLGPGSRRASSTPAPPPSVEI